MPYIGRSTDGFGVRNRFLYLASADDTSVSGADANGATLTFTDGAYVDVYLNGVLLKAGTDYNTNTANTIAGLSALAANDEVTVIVYDVFTVGDMVSATSGGTFIGAVTLTGGITGDLDLNTDGSAIKFGADGEITLTHSADDGLILKHVGTGDGKEPRLTFQAGDNDIAVDDLLGSIEFQAPDEGSGTDSQLVAASISAVSEGDFSASNNATGIRFATGASETATTKMTLTSAGRLGIGLHDPSDLLEVSNSADTPTRAIITAEDSSGSNQNAFIKTKAKGSYYEGLEMASTSGHIGMWGGYYSGSAVLQARVGGSGINSSDVKAIEIDANGHVAMPSQPAFLAYPNGDQSNMANDAVLVLDQEIYDQNADYNTSNYTFTAPVTGKYLMCVASRIDNADTSANWVRIELVTSNRSYSTSLVSPDVSPYMSIDYSIIVDMDASDTCFLRWGQSGGSATADMSDVTRWSGALIC